jgi:hypothetical protein
VIEQPSSWPLMRPSGVGSEAPVKKGGRRKKRRFARSTRWRLKHEALTVSNSGKADFQAEKGSCHA